MSYSRFILDGVYFRGGFSIFVLIIKKNVIMNQLNNLFQKGIVMLVTAMALTIPNLRRHSIIGNYHTSSMALKANAHYKIHTLSEEKPIILLEVMAGPFIAAAVVASIIEFSALIAPALVAAAAAAAGIPKEKIHLKGNHYVKNDFSLFDN